MGSHRALKQGGGMTRKKWVSEGRKAIGREKWSKDRILQKKRLKLEGEKKHADQGLY